MKSGTSAFEIIDSLPSGIIVRLFGRGWHPRTKSLELVDIKKDKTFTISCGASMEDLKKLHEHLGNFIKKEKDKT